MGDHIDVMISSTARDLPEYRKQAEAACERLGRFAVKMEDLPASGKQAIEVSLKMVEECDIYIGIFAHRYGYIADGYDKSVTEMEYDCAVESGKERYMFIMDDNQPVKPADVEKGEGAIKLETFKERLKKENIVKFFTTPEDLRAHVIHALSQSPQRVRDVMTMNYVQPLIAPPEPYIAHPYTLLQTGDLIGRQTELNLLTDWVTRPEKDIYHARILNIVAVGGMGKSALTWKWFNKIAPLEMKKLAGRFWWSFYESDARFENFIARALAYISRKPLEEIHNIPRYEQEAQLLAALNQEPFLFVLDGLERILIAYARLDAAHLDDSTAEGKHQLCKTADPRDGQFLKKLAQLSNSRILISTRIYPTELRINSGKLLAGCYEHKLEGLSDDDALDLWRKMGVSGSRDTLLKMFYRFDNYPLLIQALSGEIADSHKTPGDFDAWCKANPTFNPFQDLPLIQIKTHVLEHAMRNLRDTQKKMLNTIAAFRAPASYDTLTALLIGTDKLFTAESELDTALNELEDRGLIGWDRRANRYDLHPIVRGVVWGGLQARDKNTVYERLLEYFKSIPQISDWQLVNSVDDLSPAIELYSALIGLHRYDEAADVFWARLENASHFKLNANRLRIELLEMLFPDGKLVLSEPNTIAFYLNLLALTYKFNGLPEQALPLYKLTINQYSAYENIEAISTCFRNMTDAFRVTGHLYDAERSARYALNLSKTQQDISLEALSMRWLGIAQETHNPIQNWKLRKQKSALVKSRQILAKLNNKQRNGVTIALLAQVELWHNNFRTAQQYSDLAWELAQILKVNMDIVRSARLQGVSAIFLNNTRKADERLHFALTRARAVNYVEEELPALIGLAELARRKGNSTMARERLDEVWESAERGPYPLYHADALNVLAQIEWDEGNRESAIKAATEAYTKAWCDGISEDGQHCFAYDYGLRNAKAHLDALDVPYPVLPPFDPSAHEPLPEVEI